MGRKIVAAVCICLWFSLATADVAIVVTHGPNIQIEELLDGPIPDIPDMTLPTAQQIEDFKSGDCPVLIFTANIPVLDQATDNLTRCARATVWLADRFGVGTHHSQAEMDDKHQCRGQMHGLGQVLIRKL